MLRALREFVVRLLLKDSPKGVMTTLPNKDLVDMNVQMTAEFLMRNGVDPNSLKNANQVENAIKMIENKPKVQEGITSTKSAKVFDLEGKEIDPKKGIMGGKQIPDDDLPPPGSRGGPDDIAAPIQSEDEILEKLNRENKEARRNLQIKLSKDKGYQKFKGETEEEIRKRFGLDDPEDMAQGGRAGFKDGMDRRTFMKIMGGLATLPILGKFVKPAMPLIKKGAELSAPALDKIIEVVMSAGKLVSQSGRRLKELTTKKRLKGVEVEEDMMDGPSYTIKTKDKTIYYRPGRMDEGGLDDDIIEVIEDTVTKKASGGIARMLGE